MVKYRCGKQCLRGYFASCFLGIYLFNKSKSPSVNFIGCNFVVIPFGFVINLVVGRYDASLVLEAVRITGLVTAVMMVMGSLFPAFFKRIGALTAAATKTAGETRRLCF